VANPQLVGFFAHFALLWSGKRCAIFRVSTPFIYKLPLSCYAPQFIARYPNILPAHLTLAVVYSELGQAAEARAEIAEVLRLNPNFSLEVHKQRMPIKDPAVLERHIAALRKAGLK
jgi:hypothetical protein